MDVKQLAEHVRKMRELQRLYFRTRSQLTLEECKAAEKFVDRSISEILDPMVPDLFSQETES